MLSNLKDENSKNEMVNSIREVDFVNLSNVKKSIIENTVQVILIGKEDYFGN